MTIGHPHPSAATAATTERSIPALKYRGLENALGRLHSSTVQHREPTLRASSTRGAPHDDPFLPRGRDRFCFPAPDGLRVRANPRRRACGRARRAPAAKMAKKPWCTQPPRWNAPRKPTPRDCTARSARNSVPNARRPPPTRSDLAVPAALAGTVTIASQTTRALPRNEGEGTENLHCCSCVGAIVPGAGI